MTCLPTNKVVFFATSNIHKYVEACQVLDEYKIVTAMLKKIDAVEIQDDSLENIAKSSAIDAVRKCRLPIIVEDAGLFIEALNGFPGPYSSYVFRTVGNDGILKLMGNTGERKAYFKSVVAFHGPEIVGPICFYGEAEGKIVREKHGSQGFGFDPIFEYLNSSKTFAEMRLEEKNRYSHRSLALHKFAEWFTSNL